MASFGLFKVYKMILFVEKFSWLSPVKEISINSNVSCRNFQLQVLSPFLKKKLRKKKKKAWSV